VKTICLLERICDVEKHLGLRFLCFVFCVAVTAYSLAVNLPMIGAEAMRVSRPIAKFYDLTIQLWSAVLAVQDTALYHQFV
jgi:hypothetical protein